MGTISGLRALSIMNRRIFFSIGFAFWWALAGAAEPPSDRGDHVVTGADLAFMNEAAPGGKAEVELGRLAAERGGTREVKEFGEKMAIDHGKIGEQLQQLAEQKKVRLPAGLLPNAKQMREKLLQLHGPEFDRAYTQEMVRVHEKDVAAFQAFARNATDADVKHFAAKTLPVLDRHLKMIRKIAQQMDAAK